LAPYDLYFIVKRGTFEADIHRPGFAGFAERPTWLPAEVGPASFLDENGAPWVFEVSTDWKFPLEQVDISSVYSRFQPWVASAGALDPDWFLNVTQGQQANVSGDIATFVTPRPWSILVR